MAVFSIPKIKAKIKTEARRGALLKLQAELVKASNDPEWKNANVKGWSDEVVNERFVTLKKHLNEKAK